MAAGPESSRLLYERLGARELEAFWGIAVDPYVRKFLLDGEVVDLQWCQEQIGRSDALFDELGAGLWMIRTRERPDVSVGFCGFIRFEETGPEPQLVYALRPSAAGRGYASEAATAIVDFARDRLGLERVISAVDEPNHRSIRVLEGLGFVPCGEYPGAFGRILAFELRFST